MSNISYIIVAQKPHKNQSPCGEDRQSPQGNRKPQFEQPELFHFWGEKPQISSVPGVSPKQRDRYRVMLGDVVLGDRLTLDRAIELAKLAPKGGIK